MKTQGIYSIAHTATGRVYVGSAVDMDTRWAIHRHHLRNNTHHSPHLQEVWGKDGPEAFTFSILEIVANKADLLQREQWWIDERNATFLPAGFNCCPVAGSPLGSKHSDEAKAKMRAAKLGKPAPWNARKHTAEQNEAHRAVMTGRKRGPQSPEHRAKIGASRIGNKWGAGNKGNVGRKTSEETKDKLRASLAGNKNGLGHKHSDEVRARMSASHKAMRLRLRERRSPQPDQAVASPAQPPRAQPLSEAPASLSFETPSP